MIGDTGGGFGRGTPERVDLAEERQGGVKQRGEKVEVGRSRRAAGRWETSRSEFG